MGLDDAIKKALGVTLTPEATKALVSSEAGDFIPKEYADEFIDLVREKNWSRQLFRTITMPTATFYIPKVTGDASVYLVSTEAASPTESKPSFAAAGSVKLEAVKLMGYAEISNETDEDSRVAMMPLIKESFAQSMAAAEEQAFVLGQYDAGFAATDPRKAFKGLTKIAADAGQTVVADNDDLIATVELARIQLGVHGRNVNDLVLLVNPFTASQLRQLEAVLTIDKYGAGATIHKGEVGKVMGITIIENYYLPEDVDAPAKYYVPVTAEKGLACLVNKGNPIIGDRRKVKFDQDKIVKNDSIEIAVSERIGFTVQYAEGVCNITGLANRISV